MTAIYKREVKSYFDSMTGYVFIAFMALFTGIYFFAYNLNGGYPYFSFTLSALLTILAFGVPVLTMRSFVRRAPLPHGPDAADSPGGRVGDCHREIFIHGDRAGSSDHSLPVLPTDYQDGRKWLPDGGLHGHPHVFPWPAVSSSPLACSSPP